MASRSPVSRWVGTALIACIGVAFFGESLTPLKITSLLLIIAGVVGLNLGGQGH
jgi:multidrug transporter EmrE-like cation transporter